MQTTWISDHHLPYNPTWYYWANSINIDPTIEVHYRRLRAFSVIIRLGEHRGRCYQKPFLAQSLRGVMATVSADHCRFLLWGIILPRSPGAFRDICQTSLFSHHALGLRFSPPGCMQPVQTLDIWVGKQNKTRFIIPYKTGIPTPQK